MKNQKYKNIVSKFMIALVATIICSSQIAYADITSDISNSANSAASTVSNAARQADDAAKQQADDAAAQKAQKAQDAADAAADKAAENTAKDKQLREESAIGTLQKLNKASNLPTFSQNIHRDAPSAPGARNIASTVYYALDFIKYLIGGIAVFFIIIGSIKILTTTGAVEEEYKKQKDGLLYASIGLVLIILADTLVKKVIFGERGEAFEDISSAKLFAQQGAQTIQGVYGTASMVAGSIAILMIVYYAFRAIAFSHNEEEAAKFRKAAGWSSVGLIVIGVSELFVKGIVFKNAGSELGYGELITLIVGVTNFLASFVGILSVIMIIYAGFLYVANFGDEEASSKAKTIITGTILGILFALAAFAFTSTLVTLQAR